MNNYFGTGLDDKGNYYRELFKSGGIHYAHDLNYKDFPFNPENMPISGNYMSFYHIDGFSIVAFLGSPADNRPGSKSVFFFNEFLNKEQLIEKVKSYPYAVKIIQALASKNPMAKQFLENPELL